MDEENENKFEFLKLAKLRADKGLNKTDLANRAKVSVTTIREAEKRHGKKKETLMKIFNALNQPDLYNGSLVADDLIVPKSDS